MWLFNKEKQNDKSKTDIKTKDKANLKAKNKTKAIKKSIKLSFVDEKGKRLANDFYFKGKQGDKIQEKDLPIIKGYKLSSSIDTVPAISNKNKSVKLTYKENKPLPF